MRQRVVIVGGNAGGMSTATRLRRLDEDADIVVIEAGDHVSYASCGLPYHLDGTIPEADLAVLTPQEVGGMFDLDIRTNHEATGVDTDARTVTVQSPDGTAELCYDSLVLSPGAAPIEPPIDGIDAVETHSVRTIDDVAAIRERVEADEVNRALVVGGGYIGLEVTETLHEAGLSVTTAEMESQVMPRTLGPAMAATVHNHVREAGIDLRLDTIVSGLRPGEETTVEFADGETLAVDLVVLAAGVSPRTELAEDAGLERHESGAIRVDDQLRTSEPDVYALGDAAAVPAAGGGHAWVPLGGPANRQGRVLGTVLGGQTDTLQPVLDTAVAKVFDLTVGTVGATESPAGGDDTPEKVYVYPPAHAEYYPGAERFWLKLLFDPDEGTVRGAQSVGRNGVDKRIDVLATAMQKGATVSELAQLDLAYAPPYSSAKDPVNMAGMAAENVVEGLVDICHWHDLDGEVPPLVDCRPPEMRAEDGHIPDAHNVPLPELRERAGELPDEVITYCKMGQTSYAAARVLDQHGIEARSLSGGHALYEAVQRDREARADPPLVSGDD
ncbi:FAD-dependent oxidoreductase [Haloarcula sediminis]|uniref:FAD-dependent oxidoreductase n=1 Tax=Haloarcula sediminis TaxID=3111777 RepID=UPI002D767500|nr:FAD-dependent oxidoreductase [Haloarcula sp. CK38]